MIIIANYNEIESPVLDRYTENMVLQCYGTLAIYRLQKAHVQIGYKHRAISELHMNNPKTL
jgi:hypothetical protein